MAMEAVDHARQLRRIGREILSIVEATASLAPAKLLSNILLWLGVVPLGLGIYHLSHGNLTVAVVALMVEIGILVLHAIVMHYERRTHVNHDGRIQNLRDELLEKEEMLIGTAEMNEIRIRTWFRRYRRW